MKFAEALAASAAKRRSQSVEELAFLPATVEIPEACETLAGAIGGTIIALFRSGRLAGDISRRTSMEGI